MGTRRAATSAVERITADLRAARDYGRRLAREGVGAGEVASAAWAPHAALFSSEVNARARLMPSTWMAAVTRGWSDEMWGVAAGE